MICLISCISYPWHARLVYYAWYTWFFLHAQYRLTDSRVGSWPTWLASCYPGSSWSGVWVDLWLGTMSINNCSARWWSLSLAFSEVATANTYLPATNPPAFSFSPLSPSSQWILTSLTSRLLSLLYHSHLPAPVLLFTSSDRNIMENAKLWGYTTSRTLQNMASSFIYFVFHHIYIIMQFFWIVFTNLTLSWTPHHPHP